MFSTGIVCIINIRLIVNNFLIIIITILIIIIIIVTNIIIILLRLKEISLKGTNITCIIILHINCISIRKIILISN